MSPTAGAILTARFDGPNLLSARVVLAGRHGSICIDTDESWIWSYNNTVETSIYDGEKFDARIDLFEEQPVQCAAKPCEKAEIMMIPPIVVRDMYRPVDVIRREDGAAPLKTDTGTDRLFKICGAAGR